MKRISIFTGYFGSGKTEIAINFALSRQKIANKVVLIDLDIVNPYFRSREQKVQLAAAGINVLASAEGYFNTDLPALAPAISGALQDPDGIAIVDVGGDQTGARALGRYHNLLPADVYTLYFVINPYRPMTRDVQGISKVLREVEQASRLRVTALVSNPNLGRETCPPDILSGHRTVMDTSRQLNLPVEFLCIPVNLVQSPALQNLKQTVLPIKFFMSPPWMDK